MGRSRKREKARLDEVEKMSEEYIWGARGGSFTGWSQTDTEEGSSTRLAAGSKGPFHSRFRAPPVQLAPTWIGFLEIKKRCRSRSRTTLKPAITINTPAKEANHTLEKEEDVKSRGCPIFSGRFLNYVPSVI